MSDHTGPVDAAVDTAAETPTDAPSDGEVSEDDAAAPDATAAGEAETATDDERPAGVPPGTALVAVAFDDELKAQEALIACMRLQKRQRLKLDDAAIVIKTDAGRVRLVQTRDVNTPQGAAAGSWWGLVAGLFVGGPLIGAALGAAVGGIWAKLRDIGIDDDTMREIGETLEPGDAALFLLVTDGHRVHVLHEARRFDGRLLLSTLDDDWTRLLEEALAEGANPWG